MSLPLEFWMVLWKIVLIGALVLFGSMAVWVTIGGFFDVKRLFARLTESHRLEQAAASAEPDSSDSAAGDAGDLAPGDSPGAK